LRGLRIGGRGIAGRRLDQPGDDRGLAQLQLRGGMAEEFAGCRVDAIGAAAEIDAVEIELQYLLLGEAALQRQRKDRLAELAAEGADVGEEYVAGELLGDRRSALDPAAALDPHRQGPDQAD